MDSYSWVRDAVGPPKSGTYQEDTLCQCSDDLENQCGVKCLPTIVSSLQGGLLPDLVTRTSSLLLCLFVVVVDGFNPLNLAIYHLKG